MEVMPQSRLPYTSMAHPTPSRLAASAALGAAGHLHVHQLDKRLELDSSRIATRCAMVEHVACSQGRPQHILKVGAALDAPTGSAHGL